jgi:dTDP-4-amino-4,6-dideoxygalactose transaminase
MPRRSVNAKDFAIPFHRPHLDSRDAKAVTDVLRTGWITTGAVATQFEQAVARLLRAPNGEAPATVAVSSCTAALHLALELMDLNPGDHVIVPTMTFTATAAAVEMAGLRPIVVDVDPVTLMLTPEAIAPKCTSRVKAVMPVHYGGNPLGYVQVLEFARDHKMRVIDDAAHAFPAAVLWGAHRFPVGAPGLADATAFSFYATKTITTAEGGMLALPPALADRARRLTLHGIDADAYQRSRTAVYHYEVTEQGWKYNLPDLLAAVGLAQVAKAEALRNTRAAIAAEYQGLFDLLVKREWLTLPPTSTETESAWHLYPVRLNLGRLAKGWDRDRVGARMKELKVGTSMHYRPLHRHRYWATSLGIGAQAFPHADAAYASLLSLPIWPGMASRDVRRVAETLEDVLHEAGR